MRCDEIRENLRELGAASLPADLRRHLDTCQACAAYQRDQRLVGAGFKLLAQDAVPELSVGFAARLVRRLDEIAQVGRSGEEFMERTGRRFVYASLVLALTLLLALLVPISGPLRAPATAESYLAEPEAFTSPGDPVLGGDSTTQAPALPRVPRSSGGQAE